MNNLNKEQQEALNLINSGENIFLTGNAGTGKSFLLDYYIKNTKDKNILICAPTGVAALNIGGTTIHRAFKMNLAPQINDYITSCPDTILEADIIIIDEISMCRIDIFDHIARVLQYKRINEHKNTQLIVVGDFFQLPPVITDKDREILVKAYPDLDEGYCFKSLLWQDFNFKNIILNEVMRQDDIEFKTNLNKARVGDYSCIDYFNKRAYKKMDNAICLTATNKAANEINKIKLDELDEEPFYFKASIDGDITEGEFPTDEILELKVGARVMTIVNDIQNNNYVNGSLGTIIEIDKNKILIEFDNDVKAWVDKYDFEYYDYKVIEHTKNGIPMKKLEKILRGTFRQFPLKIAYSITMHKSQGQTYDKVQIKPWSRTAGQLYVALSRCKSINTMGLDYPISREYLKVNNKVLRLYNVLYLSEDDKADLINVNKKFINTMTEDIFNSLPDLYKSYYNKLYSIFYRGEKNE